MRATSNSLRRLCSRSFATLSRSQVCEVFIYTQQGENSAAKDSFRRKLPYDIDGRAKTNPKFFVWFGRKLAYVWNEGLQPILKHAWYPVPSTNGMGSAVIRSEEHTSELQSLRHLVCRLLLEKKK